MESSWCGELHMQLKELGEAGVCPWSHKRVKGSCTSSCKGLEKLFFAQPLLLLLLPISTSLAMENFEIFPSAAGSTCGTYDVQVQTNHYTAVAHDTRYMSLDV